MTLSTGTRLGPYEIVAPLGAGGMGEVYRARDTRLKRDVAVKVLPPAFSADADRLRRFEQEAQAAGRLNHPNILAIYDVGTHEKAPYLVSELLEGETLRERLSGTALAPRRAIEYAREIAAGLAAAHEQGIVHRDLKPENIFITKDGRVKILDFGLAKLTQAEPEVDASTNVPTVGAGTHPGIVMGTFGYMSPEQVRAKPVDHRSDIFSLGSILYEMLSGRRAFGGDSVADAMSAILREDPPEISGSGGNIPPALDRIVRHCLEKSPEQRFQSARDIAFNLEALSDLSGSGIGAIAPPGRRRARWPAPVAAAALMAIIGLAAYFAGARSAGGGAAAPQEAAFQQMTYKQEAIFQAAFAPDGRTIVYSAATVGNIPELFSIAPEYPESRPLGLRSTQLLAISSKGEMALLTNAKYVRHRLCTGTLARMPLGGGAPREILENVRQADWSPDGSSLAIIREMGGKDRLEYPIGKVLYEASGYLSDLRVSPKGDRIAFFEHPIRFDDRGTINMIDLSGKMSVLAGPYWGEEGLAWSRDGAQIYYSAGTGYSAFAIHAVTLAGRSRVALRSAGGLFIHDIAPDGRWIVTQDQIHWGMRGMTAPAKVERDLSWLDVSEAVRLSPDGRMLLFTEEGTAAGPNYAVCLRQTDGSPVIRLGEGNAHDLSPDGRWALASIPTAPDQLMLYPTGAGEPRRIDKGEIEVYSSAQWFPDGKRVLVCGSEKGRASRCFEKDVEGGAPRPVTLEGTQDGLVSPDGRTVIASSASGIFSLYPLAGGEPRPVPSLTPDDTVAGWTQDGRALQVYCQKEIPARVELLDLASGERRPLMEIASADPAGVLNVTGLTVSAGGRSYAYSFYFHLSHIFLVEGAR